MRWTWRVASTRTRTRHRPVSAVHARRRAGLSGALRRRVPGAALRGLVLVKWWLLAIPHYIVVGIFLGGGATRVQRGCDGRWGVGSSRPASSASSSSSRRRARLHRHLPRAGSSTSCSGSTAGSPVRRLRAPHARRVSAVPPRPGGAIPVDRSAKAQVASGDRRGARGARWSLEPDGTAGKIVSDRRLDVIAWLFAFAFLASDVRPSWSIRRTRRRVYLVSPMPRAPRRQTYAIVSESADLDTEAPEWAPGHVPRHRAHRSESERPVFLRHRAGGRSDRYLAGVEHDEIDDLDNSGDPRYTSRPGGAPNPPGQLRFWTASVTGSASRRSTGIRRTGTGVWSHERGRFSRRVVRHEHRRRARLGALDRNRPARTRRALRRGAALAITPRYARGRSG
jgi:hypothetical protein